MYAISFRAIGEAVMKAGPLPLQADEPPGDNMRFLSHPVAVLDGQGGKPDVVVGVISITGVGDVDEGSGDICVGDGVLFPAKKNVVTPLAINTANRMAIIYLFLIELLCHLYVCKAM